MRAFADHGSRPVPSYFSECLDKHSGAYLFVGRQLSRVVRSGLVSEDHAVLVEQVPGWLTEKFVEITPSESTTKLGEQKCTLALSDVAISDLSLAEERACERVAEKMTKAAMLQHTL